MRRIRTVSPAGNSVVAGTALSETTQTSAPPPRTVAHRHRTGIGLFGDPAEAAGHDGPAIGSGGGEYPQHERTRHDPPLVPHRHGRQPHPFLADIVDAPLVDPRR